MKVTNISIKLSPQSADRLKAFCTMTLDGEFVVRDLKIIDGTNGLFVAMPSRKLTDHCPKCGGKNHLRAKFCNDCGARLPENRVSDEDIQGKLHADIAHPINSECRNRLQNVILEAFREEAGRAGRGEGDMTAAADPAPADPDAADADGAGESDVAEPPAPEPPADEKPDEGGKGHIFGEGIL
ncbi:MAG TPA: SpoVG family protein [Phycisphaerae bacterium]|nr:SpoVG family protein [Phycisphaerae bacterium]